MEDSITTAQALEWVIAALGLIMAAVLGLISRHLGRISKDVGDMKLFMARHEERADNMEVVMSGQQKQITEVKNRQRDLEVRVASKK